MPSVTMMPQLSVLEMMSPEAPQLVTPSPERKTIELLNRQSTSPRKLLFRDDKSVTSRSKRKNKEKKSQSSSSRTSSTVRKQLFISDISSSLNPSPRRSSSSVKQRISSRLRTSIRQRKQLAHLCLDSLASLAASSSSSSIGSSSSSNTKTSGQPKPLPRTKFRKPTSDTIDPSPEVKNRGRRKKPARRRPVASSKPTNVVIPSLKSSDEKSLGTSTSTFCDSSSPPKTNDEKSLSTISTSTLTSVIPEELFDLLKPLGLSRKPRSPKEVLLDFDAECSARVKRKPSRPRSCKKRLSYSEESDEERFQEIVVMPLSPRAKAANWPNIPQRGRQVESANNVTALKLPIHNERKDAAMLSSKPTSELPEFHQLSPYLKPRLSSMPAHGETNLGSPFLPNSKNDCPRKVGGDGNYHALPELVTVPRPVSVFKEAGATVDKTDGPGVLEKQQVKSTTRETRSRTAKQRTKPSKVLEVEGVAARGTKFLSAGEKNNALNTTRARRPRIAKQHYEPERTTRVATTAARETKGTSCLGDKQRVNNNTAGASRSGTPKLPTKRGAESKVTGTAVREAEESRIGQEQGAITTVDATKLGARKQPTEPATTSELAGAAARKMDYPDAGEKQHTEAHQPRAGKHQIEPTMPSKVAGASARGEKYPGAVDKQCATNKSMVPARRTATPYVGPPVTDLGLIHTKKGDDAVEKIEAKEKDKETPETDSSLVSEAEVGAKFAKKKSKKGKKERKSTRKTALKTKQKRKKPKVSFAELPTTTTTFSVKIRVSTSVNKKSGKKKRQVAAPQGLSESAVQSIANQITQACIAQASNTSAPAEARTTSSESSSNATAESAELVQVDDSSDGGSSIEEPTTPKSQNQSETAQVNTSPVPAQLGEKSPELSNEAMIEKRVMECGNEIDEDSRSTTSDLSMPTLESKMRLNSRMFQEIETRQQKETRDHISTAHQVYKDGEDLASMADQEGGDGFFNDKKRESVCQAVEENAVDSAALQDKPDETPAIMPPSRKRLRGGDSLAGSDARSTRRSSKRSKTTSVPTSPRSRSRKLRCNDSLAGSVAERFIPQDFDGLVTKIPTEVTVKERSTESISHVKTRSADTEDTSQAELASSDSFEDIMPSCDDVDETVVTNLSTDSSPATPKVTGRGTIGKCGDCSGCRSRFDCMTCDRCTERLQVGRSCRAKYTCLARVCHLVKRRQHLDSLTQMAHSSQEARTIGDVDDSSTNFECGSTSSYGSKPAKLPSRVARYWSQKVLRNKKTLSSRSLSSYSASEDLKTATIVPASPVKKSRKRGKGKWQKKSPLHEMELPIPCDGSIASFRQNRRSLRALMQYDEADQDWV